MYLQARVPSRRLRLSLSSISDWAANRAEPNGASDPDFSYPNGRTRQRRSRPLPSYLLFPTGLFILLSHAWLPAPSPTPHTHDVAQLGMRGEGRLGIHSQFGCIGKENDQPAEYPTGVPRTSQFSPPVFIPLRKYNFPPLLPHRHRQEPTRLTIPRARGAIIIIVQDTRVLV